MTDVRDLGAMIRAPFIFLEKAINLIFRNFMPILIVAGSIWFLWWFFHSPFYLRLIKLLQRKDAIRRPSNQEDIRLQEVQ